MTVESSAITLCNDACSNAAWNGDGECNDGIDNDENGDIDADDSGCSTASDVYETYTSDSCGNGHDDDEDGWVGPGRRGRRRGRPKRHGRHGSGSDDDASTGGEWKLLTAKLMSWWEGNDLGEQLNHLRQPLRIVAILVAVVLLIKVYSGLLSAIDTIPLAPRLFELVGICWMIQFSVTRLVRSDERRDVLQSLRERWNSFTGSKN